MIEVVQAFDRAPITALKTDDASALESKLSAAARLFADRKSWLKPFERIAILRRLSVLLEGKREHFGLQIAREGGKPLADALIEDERCKNGSPPRKPGLKGENDRTVRPIRGDSVNLALNADYPR